MPKGVTKFKKVIRKSPAKTKAVVAPVPKKTEPKTAQKSKTVKTKETTKEVVASTVQLPVLGIDGIAKGKVSVSAALFGAKSNAQLVAQAVRVFLANQRTGDASTKTRGEVEGSTRKIYRQKGTGRARHGGIRAPIFVGGGIVFGPKPRDYSLKFPQKMRHLALACALSDQLKSGNVIIVDGLETLEPKTKIMAKTLDTVGKSGSTLVVIPVGGDTIKRSAGNIQDVDVVLGNNLNTYAVYSHSKIIVSKDALPLIEKTFAL